MFDVSVPVDSSSYDLGIDRVNNIGLMNDQRNGIIVAVLMIVGGVVIIVVGAVQNGRTATPVAVTAAPVAVAPDERKCPYCAETIKAEAVICRFCNRDVPPRDTSGTVQT